MGSVVSKHLEVSGAGTENELWSSKCGSLSVEEIRDYEGDPGYICDKHQYDERRGDIRDRCDEYSSNTYVRDGVCNEKIHSHRWSKESDGKVHDHH